EHDAHRCQRCPCRALAQRQEGRRVRTVEPGLEGETRGQQIREVSELRSGEERLHRHPGRPSRHARTAAYPHSRTAIDAACLQASCLPQPTRMKTRIVSDCRRRRNVLAVIVLNTATAAAAADLPWEVWKSPYAIAQLDPADQVLERSSYCLDGCRY